MIKISIRIILKKRDQIDTVYYYKIVILVTLK